MKSDIKPINNGFIVYSRFFDSGKKINNEAIRYDQIKKIYICGSGLAVCIETYSEKQWRIYSINTENRKQSDKIFMDIVTFGESDKTFLDYRESGEYSE